MKTNEWKGKENPLPIEERLWETKNGREKKFLQGVDLQRELAKASQKILRK